MAYGKLQDTYEYWEKWNRKNRNVENFFLESWEPQFNEIRNICKNIETEGEYVKEYFDHDEPYYAYFLGSIMTVTPSGKYYMPFASSNVSVKEAAIDEFWNEEFERILSEEDCWYECGEGSGTDMFICKIAPKHRLEDITNDDFLRILQETIMPDLTPADYLAIPGIYEILAEYYNNDVLEAYEQED